MPRIVRGLVFQTLVLPVGLLIGFQGGLNRIDKDKCTISGVVTSSLDGPPLANIEIVIYSKGLLDGPLFTETDAAGRYIFRGLVAGDYSVTAERLGYVTQTYGQQNSPRAGLVAVEAGQTLSDIDFKMVASGVVTGHVLGDDREPRLGADVSALVLRYIGGQRELATSSAVKTNDLGEFRLYGLSPGRYYICSSEQPAARVHYPPNPKSDMQYIPTFYPNTADFRRALIVEVRPGSETRGIEITEVKSRVLRVRGMILGMRPTAPPVRVRLSSLGVGFGAQETGVDSQGGFDFRGVVPGTYILSSVYTRAGAPHRCWRQVDVEQSEIDDADFTCAAGITVAGRVQAEKESGVVFSRLRVELQPSPSSPFFTLAPTAAVELDGSFILRDVHADEYVVGLSSLPEDSYIKDILVGGVSLTSRRIDIRNRSAATMEPIDVVISSHGARLDGVVRFDNDDPVSGARVVAVPSLNLRTEAYAFKTSFTDRTGRFSMRGIIPGTYQLFAWQSVDEGAWRDSEFLRKYEDYGQRLELKEDDHETTELRMEKGAAR